MSPPAGPRQAYRERDDTLRGCCAVEARSGIEASDARAFTGGALVTRGLPDRPTCHFDRPTVHRQEVPDPHRAATTLRMQSCWEGITPGMVSRRLRSRWGSKNYQKNIRRSIFADDSIFQLRQCRSSVSSNVSPLTINLFDQGL